MRLVPISGRVNGSDKPVSVMWVNPESIVSVTPKITGAAPAFDLHIEIKLQGLPLFDSWAGKFVTRAAADQAWDEFLAELTGDGLPAGGNLRA